MSRIIYYIGAGASYGTKRGRTISKDEDGNETLEISNGLPVVSEIPMSLLAFKKAIDNVSIDGFRQYTFKNLHGIDSQIIDNAKERLLQDIEQVYAASLRHATIDTYARKLYLTKRYNDFKTLKNVLATFFVWLQLTGSPDQRYDTFLANTLTDNLTIPDDISVVSWNYDSQFELAYRSYMRNRTFPVIEKNAEGTFPDGNNSGYIFKINGTATFQDINTVMDILNDKTIPPIIQLLIFYGDILADTSSLGFQLKSHLSFAWEDSVRRKQMWNLIMSKEVDATSLVVIGYSFPYFNRSIDREILSMMTSLKNIYIQDPNPESVSQSLRAVLPDGKFNIELLSDCSQFYLPKEL